MPNPVILYEFAGRRANMKLQVPFLRRILADHPEVEIHLWDLSHNESDHYYISTLAGERIRVMDEFYGKAPVWQHFNDVYRHYTQERYRDHLFVKIDDDVVFIETGRFGWFLQAARENPATFVSAKIINNGACTPTEPELMERFQGLRIPLLDVHRSRDFNILCHNYFFDHWPTLIGQEQTLCPTADWLSINMISYDWRLGCELSALLGQPSPTEIAGRRFSVKDRIGDEGAANMFPRIICSGFLASHLTFGPQLRRMKEAHFIRVRARYAEIMEKYLNVSE